MEDTPIFTNQEGLWKEPELFSKMKKRMLHKRRKEKWESLTRSREL